MRTDRVDMGIILSTGASKNRKGDSSSMRAERGDKEQNSSRGQTGYKEG